MARKCLSFLGQSNLSGRKYGKFSKIYVHALTYVHEIILCVVFSIIKLNSCNKINSTIHTQLKCVWRDKKSNTVLAYWKQFISWTVLRTIILVPLLPSHEWVLWNIRMRKTQSTELLKRPLIGSYCKELDVKSLLIGCILGGKSLQPMIWCVHRLQELTVQMESRWEQFAQEFFS